MIFDEIILDDLDEEINMPTFKFLDTTKTEYTINAPTEKKQLNCLIKFGGQNN